MKAGYSLFGGRGDVWSNTAHIDGNAPFGTSGYGCTLCGRPMLSTNWVRIEGIKEAGCPECIKIYNEQTGENLVKPS